MCGELDGDKQVNKELIPLDAFVSVGRLLLSTGRFSECIQAMLFAAAVYSSSTVCMYVCGVCSVCSVSTVLYVFMYICMYVVYVCMYVVISELNLRCIHRLFCSRNLRKKLIFLMCMYACMNLCYVCVYVC